MWLRLRRAGTFVVKYPYHLWFRLYRAATFGVKIVLRL